MLLQSATRGSKLALSLIAMALAGVACRKAAPAPPPPPPPPPPKQAVTTSVSFKTPAPEVVAAWPDLIPERNLRRVVPLVHGLRATPPELVLRVGQKASLSDLRIQALDAKGEVLGTLPHYGFAFTFGAYEGAGFRDIVGFKPGSGVIGITPPWAFQLIVGRPIPKLEVKVTVVE